MTTETAGDTRQAGALARHPVDGRWQESEKQLDSLDPATGEVIGRYALAGEDEARAAVAAAFSAFRDTTGGGTVRSARASSSRWPSASKRVPTPSPGC